jgi:hypothetical protein
MDLSTLPPDVLQVVLAGPALAPPLGVQSNFENPPNNNSLACTAITVCVVVATLSFFVRFYARVIHTRKVAIDDGMHCDPTRF